MIQKIKSYIIRLLAPYIYDMYKEEILRVIKKAGESQMDEVQAMILDALESGLELNIIINPTLMAPMAMYVGEDEDDEEPKRENPFKIVKDEEKE